MKGKGVVFLIRAKWQYSQRDKYEGNVLGIEEDAHGDMRLLVDPDTDRQNTLKLKPSRLSNWDNIRKKVLDKFDVESDNIEEQSREVDGMYLPAMSKRDGSSWLALDENFEVVSKHDTHTKLKSEYNVESVKGFKMDGDKYYDLAYSPETRKKAIPE